MSWEMVRASTMVYWRKWEKIFAEREKKRREEEMEWEKRKAEEWYRYQEERSRQPNIWEEEDKELF